MNCSPFDLRDYFLKELPDCESRQVDSHIKGCARCREELQQLRLTEAALFSLRDEEIPQRIAFVSDRVFEPSPLRRWWMALWGSSAKLGFASAAMLSAALMVSALMRPAPAPAPQPMAQTAPQFTAEQLDTAVAKAVAASEARQSRKTADLLAASEKRYELDRKGLLLAMDEQYEFMRKKMNRLIIAANDLGVRETGGGK